MANWTCLTDERDRPIALNLDAAHAIADVGQGALILFPAIDGEGSMLSYHVKEPVSFVLAKARNEDA